MKRGKGLTIRQKVDGHEVRIEELEKSLRARSNQIDRLEQQLLQVLSPPYFSDVAVDLSKHKFARPIESGYYWAIPKSLARHKVIILVTYTGASKCYEVGSDVGRPIDDYKLIASVSPP